MAVSDSAWGSGLAAASRRTAIGERCVPGRPAGGEQGQHGGVAEQGEAEHDAAERPGGDQVDPDRDQATDGEDQGGAHRPSLR